MSGQPVAEPSTTTIPRAPWSIRRTSHIDMIFEGSVHGGPLRLRGAARDLLTTGDGEATALAEAAVDAGLDPARRLQSLVTRPEIPHAGDLLGRHVGPGFRGAVEQVVAAIDASGSVLHLLLDDLPVAALISGYAALYENNAAFGDVSGMLKSDICAGWSHDGTMMVSLREGRGMPVPMGPVAPRLESADDPLAWHAIDELAPSSMRRRRLLDVRSGSPLVVSAMFRDSHRDADGGETVLHEYSVDATVDPESLEVLACTATPRSLPWVECPAAAASASRLEGRFTGDLRSFVRSDLTGVTTCTHLNDLLRSLAGVAALGPVLAARTG